MNFFSLTKYLCFCQLLFVNRQPTTSLANTKFGVEGSGDKFLIKNHQFFYRRFFKEWLVLLPSFTEELLWGQINLYHNYVGFLPSQPF